MKQPAAVQELVAAGLFLLVVASATVAVLYLVGGL